MPFCALWLLIEQGCFFYFAMKLTPLLLDTPIFLMFSSVSFYLHLISFNFFDAHCNVFTFFAIMSLTHSLPQFDVGFCEQDCSAVAILVLTSFGFISLTHSLPQFHVGFCEQDCAAVAILVILVTPNTSLSSSRTMKRNEIQNIGTLKKIYLWRGVEQGCYFISWYLSDTRHKHWKSG